MRHLWLGGLLRLLRPVSLLRLLGLCELLRLLRPVGFLRLLGLCDLLRLRRPVSLLRLLGLRGLLRLSRIWILSISQAAQQSNRQKTTTNQLHCHNVTAKSDPQRTPDTVKSVRQIC